MAVHETDRLTRPGSGRSVRTSSYDKTGGRDDFYPIHAGEVREICNIAGPGEIKHTWMAMAPSVKLYFSVDYHEGRPPADIRAIRIVTWPRYGTWRAVRRTRITNQSTHGGPEKLRDSDARCA